MTLMLLAPVLPFCFPLLNISVRDRHDALCQPFESLEWRFGLPMNCLLFFHFSLSLHLPHPDFHNLLSCIKRDASQV